MLRSMGPTQVADNLNPGKRAALAVPERNSSREPNSRAMRITPGHLAAAALRDVVNESLSGRATQRNADMVQLVRAEANPGLVPRPSHLAYMRSPDQANNS